ncbi:unnamed protein product [Meloidogyne enterolobii]|uniref:Uncharacterized protein n=1 Tax=Meloidogyne enterolobii TaxID=390850 RepID=A0ACB0ZDP2_MELEN
MTSLMPVRFQELFSLKKAKINPRNICFGNVTMESDKYIVVREEHNCLIINVANSTDIVRKPISAGSVMMHPTSRILSLKCQEGKAMQIFDLELKAKIKAYMSTEHVVLWTWINSNTIGFVTESSVNHWALNDRYAEPTKVFDRHATLQSGSITSYRATSDGKFLALFGFPSKDVRNVGSLQLYSTETNTSQIIEAHAACFVQLKMEGNPNPSSLCCFSLRNAAGEGKLNIMEVSQTPTGNKPYLKKTVDFVYPAEATSDFPLSMQASSTYGILYIIDRSGYVFVFEIETGCLLYKVNISPTTIFITTEHNNGFIGINRDGQVLSFCVDEETIIPYVTGQLQNHNLALKLASRLNLPLESLRELVPTMSSIEGSDASDPPPPQNTEAISDRSDLINATQADSKQKIHEEKCAKKIDDEQLDNKQNVGEDDLKTSLKPMGDVLPEQTPLSSSSSGEVQNDKEVVNQTSLDNVLDEEFLHKFDLLIEIENFHEASKMAAEAPQNFLKTLLFRKFDLLVKNGNYTEAAKMALTAPQNIFRTPETLQKFQKTYSLLKYLQILLEQDSLNKWESLEICRIVSGQKQLVEEWLSEGKLECCKELGDFIKQYDVDLASKIYFRGDVKG